MRQTAADINASPENVRAERYFPRWDRDDLAPAPRFQPRHWTSLIGPGVLMVGANIGGGEWLFGPVVTAQYGGRIMWLAFTAILLQVFYNLSVMRYALYCGESIFVGFFRTAPGPRFWTVFYLVVDFGAFWPYLSSNAAVALAAAYLGRLPTQEDQALVRTLGYGVFLACFIPLVFGGKIYNALEKVMVVKLILVLGYLGFVSVFLVSWGTWAEIWSGLFRFGSLPEGNFSWATLAAFAAVAGAGGLTNTTFSSYARDKGWGMGAKVGAIPSAVGGRKIQLSHTGKVFPLTSDTRQRWFGWLRHIRREQFLLWAPGCVLGMVLPSMMSYEFIRSVPEVEGNAAAAMTAHAIAAQHGQIFWYLTLLCGFLILAPTQVSQLDSIARRWTDVLWIGSRRLKHLDGNKVKIIYYSLLAIYAAFGLIALRVTPNPLVLAIASGVMLNFALAFSALHSLYVNMTLLPPELRPGWLLRVGIGGCAGLYFWISATAFYQEFPRLVAWLTS
jgi:hypothetical protein